MIFIQLYTEDQKEITILLVCYDHLKQERFRKDSYNPASSWNTSSKRTRPQPRKKKIPGRLFYMLPCLLLHISDKGNTYVYMAPIKSHILHLPFCWQHTTTFQTLLHPIILRKIFKKNKSCRMSRK
jgi:hypothetical protein